MKDVNKILLMGRLGADPVKKETRNGHAMTQFSLATSRRIRAAQGESLTTESRQDSNESILDPELLGASEPLGLEGSEASSGAGGQPDVQMETFADETQWHRIVVWGREAEQCAQFLKKGNTVFVEGSLRQRKFKGKDGMDRILFEVHADSVNFLSGRPRSSDSSVAA